jgi:putative membrane protein
MIEKEKTMKNETIITDPDYFSYNEKAEEIGKRLRGSFLWMLIGIMFSGISGYALYYLIEAENPYVVELMKYFFIPLIFQLVIGLLFSVLMYALPAFILKIFFILYATLSGTTFALILLKYTPGSILTAFISTSIIFVVMALYGNITKRDMTKAGGILITGLLTAIVVGFINIWFHNSLVNTVISIACVIIFSGFIAYDTQKIKKEIMVELETGNKGCFRRIEIIGAFSLYLDFVNLFLNILELTGKSKD